MLPHACALSIPRTPRGRPRRPGASWIAAALLLAFSARLARGAGDPVVALGERWRWREFDRKAGLNSNTIVALHQDRHGYIYAASEVGLSRYDSWDWTALENLQPFDDGAVVRFVESMSELHAVTANALWQVQGGTALKLSHRGASLHAASSDLGDIFVIEESAATHSQVRGGAIERIDADVRLPPGRILHYEVDPARVHWLATTEGLFSRDLGPLRAWRRLQPRDLDAALSEGRCVRFFRLEGLEKRDDDASPARGRRSRRELWALFQTSRETPAGNILARLEDGAWKPMGSIDGAPLDRICFDSAHNLYATGLDGRLFVSRDGRQWTTVLSPGLFKGPLRGGLLDFAGTLWFQAGRNGIAAFDPESRQWEAIPSGTNESFPDVLSLLETEDGEVWMGMTSGVTRHREGEEPEVFDVINGTRLEKVTGLGEDPLHRVWVSSAESFSGAFSFDTMSGSWATETLPGFSDHPIRRIVRDRLGELWFLSREKRPDGVYVIYRSALETSYDLSPVLVERGAINDLARARDDMLWIATDDGLLKGRLEEDQVLTEKRFTDRDGLLSIQVWAVTEGPDGAVWVCYPGSAGGVTRIKDGAAVSFQEGHGLASSDVWSIAAVGQSLWFGTVEGLSRHDGECWYNHPVTSRDPRSSHVWPIVASRRYPDSILVGTFGQGAYRMRPEERLRPRFTRHDFPSRAKADGTVEFSWEARDHRDHTPRRDLLYRTRVDGATWSRFSNETSRKLTGLSPGPHTFEVEVRNLEGGRNKVEIVHRFEVPERSPIRTVFIVLTAILAAGAGVAALLGRRRKALSRRRRLGLFRDFPTPLFILDAGGRVAEYNGIAPAAVGLEGARREDLIGRPLELVPAFSGSESRAALKALLRGDAALVRGRSAAWAGSGRVLDWKGFPLTEKGRLLGAAVIVEDRTAAEEEERLGERERRLSSLKRVAERMASDFGGMLRLVAARELERLDPVLEDRVRRAEILLVKLSGFAGADGRDAKPALLSVTSLLERLLGDRKGDAAGSGRLRQGGRVHVDYRGPPSLWSVVAVEALLEEALLEVLLNAVDAMNGKGTLTVRANNVRVEEDPGRLAPGPYVEVLVKDTGTGMDPAQLEHIFEPFYSTKPRDDALGVGLSFAHGVVRASGGDIRVESRPGQGTEVRLLLPARRS
ncbi:MAG TPA: ATP-binding protein [Planctomycetota bacterium]|nr:ATP-binding protein [Planctomycetota bacterium]